MTEVLPYILVGVAALGLIYVILFLLAKGKLKKLEPVIKQLMEKYELTFFSKDWTKAGAIKMAGVISELVKDYLPKWCDRILTYTVIEAICESIFADIHDNLKEICHEYRDATIDKGGE